MSFPVNPAKSSAGPKARAEPKPHRRRILVVDDNPELAYSFKVLLEAMGHEVRALISGRDLIATIRELRAEVVFLDIGMPDRDGCRLAKAIRAEGPEPRPFLVAVTGYGQDGDRNAAIEAGFDRYELKPLLPEQIEILLAELG